MSPTDGLGQDVTLTVIDHVAYVAINRPAAMNSINNSVRRGLKDAFVRIAENDEILVGVLSGAGGRAFSAGADLKEMAAAKAERPHAPIRSHPDVPKPGNLEGYDHVDRCPKPLIAAIDGYCLAGGFELALYCDIRVATAQSSFGLPEPRRSLLAGPGLINLVRSVPLGEAMRIQLTGATISSERAFQIGLVQELVPDREAMDEVVRALAAEIVTCAPLAVQYIKRIVKESRAMTVEQAWSFSEMFSASLAQTEDAAEGLRAFQEHRPPNWTMR